MRHAANNSGTLEELTYEKGKFTDGLGVTHPKSYLNKWDEAHKNSRGIYEITEGVYNSDLEERTGSVFALSGTKAIETIQTADKDVAAGKEALKQKVYDKYDLCDTRPALDVAGLPYQIYGSRSDKDNFRELFEDMTELGQPSAEIRDVSGTFQVVAVADMRKIWKAIVTNGRLMNDTSIAKEKEIIACATIAELKNVTI